MKLNKVTLEAWQNHYSKLRFLRIFVEDNHLLFLNCGDERHLVEDVYDVTNSKATPLKSLQPHFATSPNLWHHSNITGPIIVVTINSSQILRPNRSWKLLFLNKCWFCCDQYLVFCRLNNPKFVNWTRPKVKFYSKNICLAAHYFVKSSCSIQSYVHDHYRTCAGVTDN